MAFHEVQFPMPLALGAVGGPQWRTDVVTLASGQEVRNAPWATGRRHWEVGSAIADLAQLQTLVAFFEARAGQRHGFRFRDPVDHASSAPGSEISFEDQTRIESGWSVDTRTGLISFDTAPAVDAALTAGFEFDCAVRFDSDQIQTVIDAYGAGRIVTLSIIELPARAA